MKQARKLPIELINLHSIYHTMKEVIVSTYLGAWATGGLMMQIDEKFLHGIIKEALQWSDAFEFFYYFVAGAVALLMVARKFLDVRREYLQQQKDFKDDW